MSTNREPNPPSRREEDFPKTTTIPDGWITDALMEAYNGSAPVSDPETAGKPVPATGKVNGKTHPAEKEAGQEPTATQTESLFARRLDPFPSAWNLSGMWL